MTPAVTVALTAYNRERYIASSIESVLAQTFQDFELLIVDNQSTDRTVAIAKEYAARDRRIRLVVNERNIGQFGNRNLAASLAAGRFVKYHDSDDLMYPHCLEVMVRLLEAEPRAGFALSNGGFWFGGPCPMFSTPRMSYQREFLGYGLFMCGPSCALFRREVLEALGGFEDVGSPSDHLFWMKACAVYPILLVPADLFWYRMHPGQLLQSEQSARESARMPRRVWQALEAPSCPLTAEEREVAKRNRTFITAKECYRDLRAGRFGFVALRLRESGMSLRDWLRYLRPPQRTALAGTPLGPDGEYLIPEWVRVSETAGLQK